MEDKIEKIPYVKCVRLESPYEKDTRLVYHLLVNVNDVPEGLPTDVNPREVNTHKKVYSEIVNGLTADDESFFVNNRGLLISAKNAKVDALNKVFKLDIGNLSNEDNSLYGVLDGGHTYHAIIHHRDEIVGKKPVYVHLEIMTSVINIDELSKARNTSVQVSDKAIAELAHKFEFVKNAIKDEPYSTKIAYKQGEDKPIDAVDLVRLMFAFNISKYKPGSMAQPISAYSGKAQVLKDYLSEYGKPDNPYTKLAKLLPTITKLYDHIELDMPEAYLANNKKGRFANVTGVDKKKKMLGTKFYEFPTQFQITQGLLFPILGAFRSLINVDKNGSFYWVLNPIDVWDKSKEKLVNNTIEMARSLSSNPQSAGKNSQLWSQNYDAVNSIKLEVALQAYRDNSSN